MRLFLACILLFALACAGLDAPPPAQPTQPVAAQPAPDTIQGPFSGQDGAVVWVDSLGRTTGMYPADGILMFGQGDQLTWTRDAYGAWYGVQGGQLVPLAGMPPELAAWPGVQAGLPGGYALPGPRPRPAPQPGMPASSGYDPSIMAGVNDMYNDTSLEIINNLPDGRAGPVTDYYNDDGTYAGPW